MLNYVQILKWNLHKNSYLTDILVLQQLAAVYIILGKADVSAPSPGVAILTVEPQTSSRVRGMSRQSLGCVQGGGWMGGKISLCQTVTVFTQQRIDVGNSWLSPLCLVFFILFCRLSSALCCAGCTSLYSHAFTGNRQEKQS